MHVTSCELPLFFGVAVGSVSEDAFCCEGHEYGGYGSDSEGIIVSLA